MVRNLRRYIRTAAASAVDQPTRRNAMTSTATSSHRSDPTRSACSAPSTRPRDAVRRLLEADFTTEEITRDLLRRKQRTLLPRVRASGTGGDLHDESRAHGWRDRCVAGRHTGAWSGGCHRQRGPLGRGTGRCQCAGRRRRTRRCDVHARPRKGNRQLLPTSGGRGLHPGCRRTAISQIRRSGWLKPQSIFAEAGTRPFALPEG